MANVIIDNTHLTNIADAIREKTGTSDTYKPGEMATAIQAIEAGGGGGVPDLPEEAYKITGNCAYRFANSGWDWFIENYRDKITTENIGSAEKMFYNSKIEEIPFDLNFDTTNNYSAMYLFCFCRNLTSVPKITGLRINDTSSMFNYCEKLREISAESVEGIDWSYMDNMTSSYDGNRASTFSSCYSLRKFPMEFLNHGNPKANYSTSIYYGLFTNCYVLDEVVNLPVIHRDATWKYNALNNTFSYCHRLKNITFALQEDGTPYTVNWKNQTINLEWFIGYCDSSNLIRLLNYNSGITADKEVIDDATYQALKNDPDWFSCNTRYSRYNHDSAVATINSLPDTSAYLAANDGTNTIKFDGDAGELTDGGAINTLTEAEIAVAAAKGWTVSIAHT